MPEKEKQKEDEKTENKGQENKGIDYGAELEKANNRIKQAEFVIEGLKKKDKENQPDEDDKPNIEDIINQKVDEKMAGVRQELVKPQAEMLAQQRAGSDAEAKLIMFHYEHSIKPTGNVIEDIENAKVLANRKKLEAINQELEASLRARNNKSDGGSDSGEAKNQGVSEPKLSEGDKATLQRLNAKWDSQKRVFVLPSGKTWDPKQ